MKNKKYIMLYVTANEKDFIKIESVKNHKTMSDLIKDIVLKELNYKEEEE